MMNGEVPGLGKRPAAGAEEKMKQPPAPIDQAAPSTQVSVMDLPVDCTAQILFQAAKLSSADITEKWGQLLAKTMLPPYGLEHVSAKVATPRAAMLSLINVK